MNTLESYTTTNPHGAEAVCAKLTIDDLTTPFKLHDITNADEQYILSFWVKSDATGQLKICGDTVPTANEWLHRVIAFTASGKDVAFLFETVGTYYIYEPKLEIGNKSTDWTPAPEDAEQSIERVSASLLVQSNKISGLVVQTTQNGEDLEELSASVEVNADSIIDIVEKTSIIDGQIEYNKTEIEQLADRIANLVVDKNGMSLMTQTADGGWVLNMAEYDEALSGSATNIEELFTKLGQKDTDIAAIQQTLLDMGVKTAWIHEGEYNGQPCIELGENDSNFRLRITNTAIQFMVGSNVLAYITNEEMHIRKAVIDDELQMGGFAWVKHGSGNQNMGLIWRGVSS